MSENILVPIDFSDATDAVAAKATQLAKALGAKMWLIHTGDSLTSNLSPLTSNLVEEGEEFFGIDIHRDSQCLCDFGGGFFEPGLDVSNHPAGTAGHEQ